jgi:hypothetical protein
MRVDALHVCVCKYTSMYISVYKYMLVCIDSFHISSCIAVCCNLTTQRLSQCLLVIWGAWCRSMITQYEMHVTKVVISMCVGPLHALAAFDSS